MAVSKKTTVKTVRPDKVWRVEAVLYTESATEFAGKLERVMNQLENEGYQVAEPKPIGQHYFLYGRKDDVYVVENNGEEKH